MRIALALMTLFAGTFLMISVELKTQLIKVTEERDRFDNLLNFERAQFSSCAHHNVNLSELLGKCIVHDPAYRTINQNLDAEFFDVVAAVRKDCSAPRPEQAPSK